MNRNTTVGIFAALVFGMIVVFGAEAKEGGWSGKMSEKEPGISLSRPGEHWADPMPREKKEPEEPQETREGNESIKRLLGRYPMVD